MRRDAEPTGKMVKFYVWITKVAVLAHSIAVNTQLKLAPAHPFPEVDAPMSVVQKHIQSMALSWAHQK